AFGRAHAGSDRASGVRHGPTSRRARCGPRSAGRGQCRGGAPAVTAPARVRHVSTSWMNRSESGVSMTTPADRAPRLKAPAGTCDTHMHFYDKKFPLAPTAVSAPPEDGSVASYRKVARQLGISRTVVVQPTAYGLDNRCTL